MSRPTDAAARKALPLASGCLDYFPDALLAVAELSRVGNDQHNPGQPLHWAKEKSRDEADALLRHLIDRGTIDTDGIRHSAKVAWRALALLQREIDRENGYDYDLGTDSWRKSEAATPVVRAADPQGQASVLHLDGSSHPISAHETCAICVRTRFERVVMP